MSCVYIPARGHGKVEKKPTLLITQVTGGCYATALCAGLELCNTIHFLHTKTPKQVFHVPLWAKTDDLVRLWNVNPHSRAHSSPHWNSDAPTCQRSNLYCETSKKLSKHQAGPIHSRTIISTLARKKRDIKEARKAGNKILLLNKNVQTLLV